MRAGALLPACAVACACALVRATDLARAMPTRAAQALEAILLALFVATLAAAIPRDELRRAAPLALGIALVLALVERVATFAPLASGDAMAGWTTSYGPLTSWPAFSLVWPGVGLRATLTLGRAALLAPTALLLAIAWRQARRAAVAGSFGAGLFVSACASCVAPGMAFAAALGVGAAPSNPTSFVATAIDLAVPLLALAALERAPTRRVGWAALLAPAAAFGDLASGTSDRADLIHRLYVLFNVVAILVTAAFLALLVFVLVRDRSPPGDELAPRPMPSLAKRRAINLAWTAGLLALLVAMAGISYATQRAIESPPAPDALRVRATAMQWGWSFQYPDNSTTFNVLTIPHGRDVDLVVTSRDVLHSFFVPDLGVQINAVPGRDNEAHFAVLRAGNWTGSCAEYCGIGHTDMGVTVAAS